MNVFAVIGLIAKIKLGLNDINTYTFIIADHVDCSLS